MGQMLKKCDTFRLVYIDNHIFFAKNCTNRTNPYGQMRHPLLNYNIDKMRKFSV